MKTILYKQNKTGKIQVYISWTEGPELFSKFGELDGKMQTSSIVCKGKNIGKSNESSPEEQAVREGASKIQLKRDKGYFDTIQEAQTVQVFLPMLAKDGRKVKIKYPCDAQPKLDGVRCMANGPELMSRGGKPYTVSHISAEVPLTIPPCVLDGELYIHGMPLQQLVSLVKKPKPGSENVEYWVYDLYLPDLPEAGWTRRKNYLSLVPASLLSTSSIKVVPSTRVNNEEEMKKLHDKFVQEGYEGIILRDLDAPYGLNQRSSALIKYKEFEDDEFLITGYKEGKGKFVGCVTWICETADGESFDCTPRGTLDQKKKWYNKANDIVGKMLTVRYQAFTDRGVPQFPVGITIRDYE